MKSVASLVLVATLLAGSARAQEPAASSEEEVQAKVKKAIAEYVQKDVELKEAFLILDPRDGSPLRLQFDHVHDGVKPHDQGYVVCVDFKGRQGTLYDVDVVVGLEGDDAEIRKVFVHKVDGKKVEAPKPAQSGPKAKSGDDK